MLVYPPTEEQIRKVEETYHRFPNKEIGVDMIKEARRVSGLGMMTCKKILTDYVKRTYGYVEFK